VKILITGGSGFVGSHLCRHFGWKGHEILNLDIAKQPAPLAEHVRANISDFGAVDMTVREFAPTAVIHAAALCGVRQSFQFPDDYVRVNVLGTSNVLRAAVAHGVPKFLYISSSTVYGNDQVGMPENVACYPSSPYGATKLAGEHLVQVAAATSDMQCVIARLFAVYGPGQRPDLLIAQLIHSIECNINVEIWGDGTFARDHTHISDIVFGLEACLEHEYRRPTAYPLPGMPPAAVFNLGSSSPVETKDLVFMLEDLLDKAAKRVNVPAPRGHITKTWANLKQSRLVLGYRPLMTLRHGLKTQIEWVREKIPF
jgi:nucleoside-diphosphate-sugar epimerase